MGHAVVARGISPLRVGPGLGDSPLRVVQGVVSLQPSPQRVASLCGGRVAPASCPGVRTVRSASCPRWVESPVSRLCVRKKRSVVPFLERWAPSSLFGPKLTSQVGKNKIPVRTAVPSSPAE